MKKFLSLLLTCAMMLGMAIPALAYDGTAPIAEEPVKFSLLATNRASLSNEFEGMDWWQEVLKRANVEIDYELIDSSSYNDVIKPRLAAGQDLADLVMVPGSSEELQAYIDAGLFLDLTDYYNTMAFNYNKQFEKHPSLKGEITTVDGKIYALPYIYTTDSNMRCMLLNSHYVEKLGKKLEDIETIDDFYDYLVAVKAQDMNGNGDPNDEVPMFVRPGQLNAFGGLLFGLDLADAGGYQLTKDGKVICTYTDPRYKEFLTFFKKLYDEGLLYNEFATSTYDTQQSLLITDCIGCMPHFISNCTGYSQTIDSSWDFYKDAPIFMPTLIEGPHGDKNCYGRDSYGGSHMISASCENPEAVFAFCDYLQSEEVGVLTWYGIEGVDYSIVDGEYEFKEGYIQNEDDYLTKMGYNFDALPSYQLDYMTKQCMPVREKAKELAPFVYNPTITFSFKTPAEAEVLGAYAADLKTYFDENMLAFIMGTRSLDEFDAYVAEVESMGLQEVLDVYQGIADRASK